MISSKSHSHRVPKLSRRPRGKLFVFHHEGPLTNENEADIKESWEKFKAMRGNLVIIPWASKTELKRL